VEVKILLCSFNIYILGPLQRFVVQSFKHKESDELAKAAHQPIQQIKTPIQFGDTAELSPAPPAPVKDFDTEETGAPSVRPESFQKDDQKDQTSGSEQNKEYGANFRIVPRQKQPTEAPFIRNGLKLPSTLKPAVGEFLESGF
jgi:hypothetical protein